ncbi:MAG: hypothetical protein A3I05_01650 [Deltaproteobacteria bacterium RIFCSPLOWO2_02_FULL_44_10]|nr:MAG: hypothetical protein A3C46_05245 [Deltaproteobacteria bacterium RIFCSPHIGHO2_02_FULL_44_16]OGQ45354.1 MAG: hypothetical protein A3I05_01650 [Deltaproteobacteria bacterium RIFCSPLOWO2_02_FULL_44_10]
MSLSSAPRHIRLTTSGKDLDRCDVVLGGKIPKENPNPNILHTIQTGITEAIFGLYFHFDAPLVQNEKFRKALSPAINRQELFSDEENLSLTHTMIPRQFRKKKYLFPEPEYNPQKARMLFKEMIQQYNVSKLIVPDRNPTASPWKQKLERHLNDLGLPVEFQYGKNIANYDSQTKTMIPFSVLGFIPSVFTAAPIFKVFQSGGGWVSRLPEKDHLYDDLVSKGLQLPIEEQDGSVIKLQHRFLEKVYALPLYETKLLFFSNPKTIKTLHPEKQNLSFRMKLVEPLKTPN